MTNLEVLFGNNLKWWNEHCEKVKFSSRVHDYLDCFAYTNLVVLGKSKKKEVLELIRENCENVPSLCLSFLVNEIVGNEFYIPRVLSGKVQEVRAYTLGWLEGYLLE